MSDDNERTLPPPATRQRRDATSATGNLVPHDLRDRLAFVSGFKAIEGRRPPTHFMIFALVGALLTGFFVAIPVTLAVRKYRASHRSQQDVAAASLKSATDPKSQQPLPTGNAVLDAAFAKGEPAPAPPPAPPPAERPKKEKKSKKKEKDAIAKDDRRHHHRQGHGARAEATALPVEPGF